MDIHFDYNYGDTVEDSITGKRGVLTAICAYVHDQTQCRIEYLDEKGNPADLWVPVGRIKRLAGTSD